jgi:hypothetical protein
VPSCNPPVWTFFAHEIEPPVIPASAFATRPPSVAADNNDSLDSQSGRN